jgi:hypothetical protein
MAVRLYYDQSFQILVRTGIVCRWMSRPCSALQAKLREMRYAPLFVLLPGLLQAQSAAGIAPAWDVRSMLEQLVEQTSRFKTTVDQLRISQWMEKGASDTYRRQQQVVQTEAGYLSTVSSRLATQPEKLSLVLDAYFRLQSIEGQTSSLAEGAARFEDQAAADALRALIIATSESRNKLRQYMMDLSVTKEQEFAVAEREAQRCQAELNRNPLAPPPPSAKPIGKTK